MRVIVPIFFLIVSISSFSQVEYGRLVCKTFSDSLFYGRGYIRGGDSLAADRIAKEFQRLEVPPFGASYFQKFKFGVNTFPTDIRLSINGKELQVGKEYIPNHKSGPFTGEWKFREITLSELLSPSDLTKIADSITKKYYNSVVLRNNNFKNDTLKKYGEAISLFNDKGNVLVVTKSKLVFSVGTMQLPFAYFTVVDSIMPTKITSIYSEIQPVFNPKHATQNVIAKIPSKKKNAKDIFFTAHYDHLGGIGNQIYFPGASDNASGTAMLLTMAKYYQENPSKKFNMVFIAFAGEEAGLIGSNYYVLNPFEPLNKIRFLVNLDLMGNGEDGASVVNGNVHTKEFALLKKINKTKKYLKELNSRGKAANSDHHFFSEEGVPAFFMYTLGKNTNYHDVFDTYEELSFAKFSEIVHLWIDFVSKLK